jgi:hypothetical protein
MVYLLHQHVINSSESFFVILFSVRLVYNAISEMNVECLSVNYPDVLLLSSSLFTIYCSPNRSSLFCWHRILLQFYSLLLVFLLHRHKWNADNSAEQYVDSFRSKRHNAV